MENHKYGRLESMKFDSRRESYRRYIAHLQDRYSDDSIPDFLEHIGTYVGHMSLNRMLALYEHFKATEYIAGHIADIGTYKGGSAFLFAKLMRIFGPETTWQVHTFDWFKGMLKTSDVDADYVFDGGYSADEAALRELASLQQLDNILHIHNLDVTAHLDDFFKNARHLYFRLIFMDAGYYDVMKAAIPKFWNRLMPGGRMVFDQVSHEFSPGEIQAIVESLPGFQVQTNPSFWMPNAYIEKPCT